MSHPVEFLLILPCTVVLVSRMVPPDTREMARELEWCVLWLAEVFCLKSPFLVLG